MTQPARRPDESMTLLTSMLERPLDLGYQEAADRRTAAGLPAATSTRTAMVVVMAVLTGFLFAAGALALRPEPTAAAALKAELVARIEAVQERSTAQTTQLETLAKQVRDLEALALRQSGQTNLTDSIKKLEIASGAVALQGKGLTLTLDDAASLDADADAGNRPTSGFQPGRVAAGDLQIIVNGLWGAGAEAISINGHRLTSTAAIRFAGQAIIVDFRPLARPYVITVLGDSDRTQALFEPSFAGVYLSGLTDQYGIRSVLAKADSLSVPADSGARLFSAKPIRSNVGSSGPASGAASLKVSTTPTSSSPTPTSTSTSTPSSAKGN